MEILRNHPSTTGAAGNALQKLRFCSGFADRNLCWRAFVRLKLPGPDYENVLFNRDWLTRDWHDDNLYPTRKWAERAERGRQTIVSAVSE